MENRNNEIRRYEALNNMAKAGATVIFGSDNEVTLPVSELRDYFSVEESILNRSFAKLSLNEAAELYERCIAPVKPSKVLVRIGDTDAGLLDADSDAFDRACIGLIAVIRRGSASCRIALLSAEDENVNNRLRGIASSCGCEFCDVKAAGLCATSTVADMCGIAGLNRSLSLNMLTRVLYSFENETPVHAEAKEKVSEKRGFLGLLRFARA